MTSLDSIFKSRDITLPKKVRLVKAMVFPMVMYGCESWTVKKAKHRRLDALELWRWRRLLRVLGLHGDPTSPALKANSLPPEPPRKPKNTGVGSLSLLQGVFSTQESNRGLLHCRWRYQGSPTKIYLASNVNRVEIQKLCSRGYVRTQLILNTAL